MGVGAAIAGGTAVAGLAGSLISSSASKSAADTQAAAANQASQNALAQYQQTRSDLSPYRASGTAALGQLDNILGIGGTPASSTTTYSGGGGQNGGSGLSAIQSALATGSNASLPGGYSAIYDGSGGITIADPGGNYIQTYQANGNPSSLAGDIANLIGQGGNGGQGTSTTVNNPGVSAQDAQQSALGQYGLSGLTYQGPTQFTPVGGTVFNPTQAQLASTPGYQFDLQQGLQATQNSNAAKGLGVSGAALKGAANYATGLANNTLTTQQGIFQSNLANQENNFNSNYQRGYNTFQSNLGNVINPLEYLSNQGQNAAATTGQQGIAAVGNANALTVGGANAQAAGTVGSANALSSGLTGVSNSATNGLLLNNLLSSNAYSSATPGANQSFYSS